MCVCVCVCFIQTRQKFALNNKGLLKRKPKIGKPKILNILFNMALKTQHDGTRRKLHKHLSPRNVTHCIKGKRPNHSSLACNASNCKSTFFFFLCTCGTKVSQLATKICIKGDKTPLPACLSETVRFFKIAAESWSVKLNHPLRCCKNCCNLLNF